MLMQVLSQKKLTARVYVTADHGILWRHEHNRHFEYIDDLDVATPRLSVRQTKEEWDQYSVRIEAEGVVYYPLKYPFLGSKIKANDNGVHGGISYQESIVPFAMFEV
jgi:hypothetical protein